MSNFRVVNLLIGNVFGCMGLSFFLVPVASVFAQDKTQVKQVVVEIFTRVGVTEFAKEREIKREACSEISDYSTPELATESQFSCMAAQDFDTWLRGWSPESVDLMKKRYVETNTSPADIKKNWVGMLDTRRIFLSGKAEYVKDGIPYVLVKYRAASGSNAEVATANDFANVLSFKRVASRWYQVQDLSSDPVFIESKRLWDFSNDKIVVRRPSN